MANFAPVLPLSVAQKFKQENALGRYHLLLAHEVCKDPEGFSSVYGDIECGNIILDNSVFELGYPLDLEHMKFAAEFVHADVVVLPDILMDNYATLKCISEAVESWSELLDDNISFMGVPQGTDYKDWLNCLESFRNIPRIEWIGIPKNLRTKLNISRVKAVEDCTKLFPGRSIHLLGFSNDLQDDILATRASRNVWGIDSTVPPRLGMRENKLIQLLNQEEHIPRGDWFENPGDNILLGIENTNRVREWVGG